MAMSAFFGLLGISMIPSVEDQIATYIYSNFRGFPLTVTGSLLTVRHFVYCTGDYIGCVKKEGAEDLVHIFGWEKGIGNFVPFSVSLLKHAHWEMPMHFSHAAYRNITHDPKAGRPMDAFVFSKKSDLPDGVLPDLEKNILLNFDTGTEEHWGRRKLIADMLPALNYTDEPVKLKIPNGENAKAFAHGVGLVESLVGPMLGGKLKKQVFDLVGLNIFQQLFGVDISEHLDDHFEYDKTFAPGVIGVPVMGFQGKRLKDIRAKIFARIKVGDIGRAFIKEAEKRGWDGETRLNEMVWIAMFAGYGGTGNLAYETLKFIVKDPETYVPLYKKDPRAFMIEAARHFPPVGGMNPVAYREDTTHTLANGVILTPKAGDLALTLSSGANMDPQVFKEPHAFIPNRPNGMKLLSWNNELDAFMSCDSVAGCPAAPRGCPGTWLSLRVATAAVGFFVDGLVEAGKAGNGEKSKGASGEL